MCLNITTLTRFLIEQGSSYSPLEIRNLFLFIFLTPAYDSKQGKELLGGWAKPEAD